MSDERLSHGMARQRLYAVMENDDLTLTQKQERALSIGLEYFAVDNSHIQVQDEGGETHTVGVSVGDDLGALWTGRTIERTKTYCRRTIQQHAPIALSDAPSQGWGDDPAYVEHEFDCYLGTTIFVDGETYGTVCFVSRDAREAEFSTEEELFIELLARLLGREIQATRERERLAAESQARQRAENKYEALLETAPDAIFLFDSETGAIVSANQQAVELTGYTQAQLQERTVLDLHPEDRRAAYETLFERTDEAMTHDSLPDGSPLSLTTADGETIPVEISATETDMGDRRLVQSIVRDITDRRERQRDLRLKNRAIEEASVGITIADATEDDLPLVYANQAFEELTGYDRTDVIGDNCRFLQGPETDPDAVDEIRQAISDGEPTRTQLRNYRADGSPFWNELTLTPIAGADGEEVSHFVGFQQDITPQRRRGEIIGILNRVLRHNLRNRLTVITGYADHITNTADPEIAEIATRITEAADSLTAVTEKARSIETFVDERARTASRDLVADVEAVVEPLRDAYPDTEIRVKTPDSVSVLATPQVRRALRELLDNAARHTASTVTVTVSRTDDGFATVTVSDDGPGLSDTEKHVLETGTDSSLEHGSGLGHWIVNWIVTSIGGDLTVDIGDGTTVTVHVPLATAETTLPRLATAGEPRPRSHSEP